MQIVQGVDSLKSHVGPTALTIGNFDGIHGGHEVLINHVVQTAREKKIQGGLLTFEPHPLKILVPGNDHRNIFDIQDRIANAGVKGLDFFVIEPFSRELSQLEPEEFFKRLLIDKLRVKYLFVGHDFSFGKNRAGSLEVLKDLAIKYGVTLKVVPPVTSQGEAISSTKIRQAVAAGEMEKVQAWLKRPFYIKGVIEKGAGRGRQIGYPTANLFTAQELFPRMGVYVTTFRIGHEEFHSVTNVGKNPTFAEATRRPIQVETHILDFDRDIYGELAVVSFLHFLRSEAKFNSIQELIAQIGKDAQAAKDYSWPKK